MANKNKEEGGGWDINKFGLLEKSIFLLYYKANKMKAARVANGYVRSIRPVVKTQTKGDEGKMVMQPLDHCH